MHFVICLVLLTCSLRCFGQDITVAFAQKLQEGIPPWMRAQVREDLAPFRQKPISLRRLVQFYHSLDPYPILLKATIINNRLCVEAKGDRSTDVRFKGFEDALRTLCKMTPMPNVTLLISLEDGFFWDYSFGELPLFASSKEQGEPALLLPDYEALRGTYQILKKRDITVYEPKWKRKKDQLIWRGSTAQQGWRMELTADSIDHFSRIKLCRLSELYPAYIDAKFTIFAQGGEKISALQVFRGDWIPYERQVKYKYQMLIDGNVSSYTASGWRFFSNSVVFKPESVWIQWYFGALKPYVHYVPVRADLGDLLQQIRWAIEHDKKARHIAKKARDFALTHLTVENSLLYLYHLIWEYSRLQFVN